MSFLPFFFPSFSITCSEHLLCGETVQAPQGSRDERGTVLGFNEFAFLGGMGRSWVYREVLHLVQPLSSCVTDPYSVPTLWEVLGPPW